MIVIENDKLRQELFSKPTFSVRENKGLSEVAYRTFMTYKTNKDPVIWEGCMVDLTLPLMTKAHLIFCYATGKRTKKRAQNPINRSYSKGDYKYYLKILPSILRNMVLLKGKTRNFKNDFTGEEVFAYLKETEDKPYYIVMGAPFSGKSHFSRLAKLYYSEKDVTNT